MLTLSCYSTALPGMVVEKYIELWILKSIFVIDKAVEEYYTAVEETLVRCNTCIQVQVDNTIV